jgi:hypothetical protein
MVSKKLISQGNQPPTILPVGANWGEVTQLGGAYLNGGSTGPSTASLTAHADMQEKRTILKSSTGELKISATADLEAFKIGGEYGSGFTISTANNIYNQYSMNTGMMLSDIRYSFLGNSTVPNFNIPWTGLVQTTQIGILRNE